MYKYVRDNAANNVSTFSMSDTILLTMCQILVVIVTQLIVYVYQMKFIPQIHMYFPLLTTGWLRHAVTQLSLYATVSPYQPKQQP